MAKIYIIDHSLKNIGGHHYDYVLHTSQAASRAGLEVIVAANRSFQEASKISEVANIFPLFRHTTYSPFTETVASKGCNSPVDPYQDNQKIDVFPLRTIFKPRKFRRRWNRYQERSKLKHEQKRRINHIVDCCTRLFRKCPINRGDHIFIPTLTEFDLVGFVRFIESFSEAIVPDWHFQFHYGFLEGRRFEYANQFERLESMREHFRPLVNALSPVRSHFYATTPALVSQFNHMQLINFQLLPYPVNPAFKPSDKTTTSYPLRVICPGTLRPEKGALQLHTFFKEMMRDNFCNGRLQFWVQSNKVENIANVISSSFASVKSLDDFVPSDINIIHVPHPLDSEDYVKFLRNSDLGLLLYDARTYYARCSGILIELRSAGVPIIVPAGCWMADEISKPNFDYLDEISNNFNAMDEIWLSEHALTRSEKAGCEFTIKSTSRHAEQNCLYCRDPLHSPAFLMHARSSVNKILVDFRWGPGVDHGTYIRIRLLQFDSAGNRIEADDTILGIREGNLKSLALFNQHPSAHRLQIEFSNAYTSDIIKLVDARLRFFNSGPHSGHFQLGKVGMVASDLTYVPKLLREFVQNADHYKLSARSQAFDYAQKHSPDMVIKRLLEND